MQLQGCFSVPVGSFSKLENTFADVTFHLTGHISFNVFLIKDILSKLIIDCYKHFVINLPGSHTVEKKRYTEMHQ